MRPLLIGSRRNATPSQRRSVHANPGLEVFTCCQRNDGAAMSRVLVIDDDAFTLLTYKGILRAAGHEVATAALGEDGVSAASRDDFDVVVCDQRLPDWPGVEVVRRIREISSRTAIVLVTGWGTPDLIIESKRAGATSYAEKPLVGDELLSVIDQAMRIHASAPAGPNPGGYAARRWADLVVHGLFLADDPKTVQTWAQGIAIAVGTLKKRCEAVHVTPKESLDLVRLLRVVIHDRNETWDLQRTLDIIDERTAHALLARAGLLSLFPRVPDLESFLSSQRLVVDLELLNALRMRLVRFANARPG